jgi:hypothetical protein
MAHERLLETVDVTCTWPIMWTASCGRTDPSSTIRRDVSATATEADSWCDGPSARYRHPDLMLTRVRDALGDVGLSLARRVEPEAAAIRSP